MRLLWFARLVLLLLVGRIVGGVIGALATKRSEGMDEKKRLPPQTRNPRNVSWYYLTNDLFEPGSKKVVQADFLNTTTLKVGLLENIGDVRAQWSLQPITSRYAQIYREQYNISSKIYALYNRAENETIIEATRQWRLESQTAWWWFKEHPIAPYVYVHHGGLGPDFAVTLCHDSAPCLSFNLTDDASLATG